MRSRTAREGSVGLLTLLGLGLFGVLVLWLRGVNLGQRSYKVIVEFESASGMELGTSVRYRGINVGQVVGIKPRPNGVDISLEIKPEDLIIPSDVFIQANTSSFIGTAVIDITPRGRIPESEISAGPLSSNCPEIIICNNDRLQGQAGVEIQQLLRAGIRLIDLYSDPELFSNVKIIAENTANASAEASKLTKQLTDLSETIRGEVQGISQYLREDVDEITGIIRAEVGGLTQTLEEEIGGLTNTLEGEIGGLTNTVERDLDSLTKTVEREVNDISNNIANVTKTMQESTAKVSEAAIASANSVEEVAKKVSLTAEQVNSIVNTNRSTLIATLDNIEKTTEELAVLMESLSPIVSDIERGELIGNLEILSANAVEASANLRDISSDLNSSTNIIMLQQTLDSARATFQNVQKMTSDLDDLTGDDRFRRSLKQIINGLGDLFSSTKQLEQQTRMAKNIETLLKDSGNSEVSKLDISGKEGGGGRE
ncbi:MlaD family protein [Okeania sp. SIO1I7]|uniref:MlaD family protein n=1 Tax=Okeania sp. SIO1I7 TaxID=2607772 RepID=UPI0013F9B3F4|nr:MlaD family protein [Okeania sp. SIO1I7]NET28536.1 MCE family protein [Okeania sp. SIO1I7]